MKTILTFLILIGIVGSTTAQIATNATAQFKTKVVLKEARSIGGAVMTSISPWPEGTAAGNETKDIGTSAGREYELAWKFLGRKEHKDVYQFTFTRMPKAGVLDKITTSKEVLFEGKRVIVFEDDLHTVIIESPSEADLKEAGARNQI